MVEGENVCRLTIHGVRSAHCKTAAGNLKCDCHSDTLSNKEEDG